MTDNPLVSICTLTFNHAKFIRQCLDGFLMQDREFGIEILIHDDASTDGTVEILREYEAKYPGLIFPLYESENQYSRGGAGKMDFFNYNRARGKYIACCEGDDYWTDPLKLQKQVDFMEANPEYSVCFHRTRHWNVNEDLWADDDCGALVQDKEGVDIDLHTFFSRWYTQPLSMVFRKSMFSFEWHKKYKHYRDTYEIYHLLKKGKGYLFSFVGGVYVKHSGGISSLKSYEKACVFELESAEELYKENRDKATYKYWKNVVLWSLDKFNNKGLRLVLIKRCLKTSFSGTLKIVYSVLKTNTKKSFKKIIRKLNKFRFIPIKVFVFHQVSDEYDSLRMWECDWTQLDIFKNNIYCLQKKYKFISLSEAQKKLIKNIFRIKHYAVLTCDDGYASLKNILPWLQQHNIPITLFINGKYLDGQSWSPINEKQALSTDPEIDMTQVVKGLYLTKEELWSLDSNLIEIGSHGFEHFNSTDLSLKEFENNLIEGLSSIKGHPRYIPFFAYPFGSSNCKTDACLNNRGLIPVYVNDGNNYHNSLRIERKCIDGIKL